MIPAMLPKVPKSLSLLLLLLSLFLPFGASLSFNFPYFNQSTPVLLNLRGDAFWHQDIQLTKNEIGPLDSSIGRAVYPEPLLLWDLVTRNLTDFTTHFSFKISSNYNTSVCPDFCAGDGLAFFLSPYPDSIPANSSGGYLGLFSNDSALDTSKNRLVAVEFDTYPNSWDPRNYHIGIDINSINSASYVNCKRGITRGRPSNATISYNSSTQMLLVIVTYNDIDDDPYSIEKLSVSSIVDLRDVLPSKVAVGFSAATGSSVELHEILSWDFSSNLLAPTPASAPAPTPPPEGDVPVINTQAPVVAARSTNDTRTTDEKVDSKIKLLTGLVSGIGALMIVSGLVWFILWYKISKKHKREEDNVSIDSDELERGRGPKRFSFNDLAVATNNFAEEGKLGEGGFGKVYKGFLNGEDVAIKRVSTESQQGKKEYISEVKIISQLRHRNLVQLVGWCHDNGEFLLAYKFMSNGSLDSHLYNKNRFLSWPMRYKIANHLASALLYLHEGWEQCVVHRDVKPSNVMLDSAFNVKLGDFGLARLIDHENGSHSTILAGTRGYMAPENYDYGRATKESDVYSFGVVALEIACGRKPIQANTVKLVDWVWELYGKGMVLRAADERLGMDFDERDMKCLMVVGLWCANPYSSQRPSIRQVVSVLNLEAPLPDLPLEMPVPVISGGRSVSGRALVEGPGSAMNSASTSITANSSRQSTSSG